jgi:hypothetical protein
VSLTSAVVAAWVGTGRAGLAGAFARLLLLASAAFAQSFAVAGGPLPAGLAAVWRIEGRTVSGYGVSWALLTFSNDGGLVGVADEAGTRVYAASDGALRRSLPLPAAIGQSAYSLAVSSSGIVAIGRVGAVEVHAPGDSLGNVRKFYCAGTCGPVSAAGFSADGRWLAYQASHGLLEPGSGFVSVADLRAADGAVRHLEASATRAAVRFSAPGATLFAANAVRVDGVGLVGMRAFDAATGRRLRDMPGGAYTKGVIGPFASTESHAVYQRDGFVELRGLATGVSAWSVPLAPPDLESSEGVTMKLDFAVLSERGALMLSYESPIARAATGVLVLRRLADGEMLAIYDVPNVSAIALAPDGGELAYLIGAGRTEVVVASVPR